MTNVRVSGISIDTRTLSPGDLFVAIEGPNFDGHAFLDAAVDGGAAALIVRKDALAGRPAGESGVPVVAVKDTRKALLDLASWYRARFSPRVAGITGSNGKTTTKDLLGTALSACGKTVYSERSFNNFIGVPLTLFRIAAATRYAVLEIGTNAPHEVRPLTRAARPEIGVVTNISHAHLKGLGSLAGVAKEKADLLRNIEPGGTALLNRDDSFFETLRDAALDAGTVGRLVTFGFNREADYFPESLESSKSEDGKVAPGRGAAGGVSFRVRGTKIALPLLGKHNVYNALAAFACAVELGADPERVAAAFGSFRGTPMRLQPKRAGSLLILDDAWNANPGSVAAALGTFADLPAPGRKIVVLGDMLELGEGADELHRKAGRELARGDFALVAVVGSHAAETIAGAEEAGASPDRLRRFDTTGDVVAAIPALVAEGDSILVKGSRGMELEKVVKALAAFEVGREGRSKKNANNGTVS
jgi:UDP-N-acetylmuramoyl-tripeptide--D-alanyl-D-alanine ligase